MGSLTHGYFRAAGVWYPLAESCSGHYSADLLAGMGLQDRQADGYEVQIQSELV